jgi:hypothetical protein
MPGSPAVPLVTSISRDLTGEPGRGPALSGWGNDTGSLDNHYVLHILVFILSMKGKKTDLIIIFGILSVITADFQIKYLLPYSLLSAVYQSGLNLLLHRLLSQNVLFLV